MIIGRIAFGLIILVGSLLWISGLATHGDGIFDGRDIPEWLFILGVIFFPLYVTITLCLILMHFGLL